MMNAGRIYNLKKTIFLVFAAFTKHHHRWFYVEKRRQQKREKISSMSKYSHVFAHLYERVHEADLEKRWRDIPFTCAIVIVYEEPTFANVSSTRSLLTNKCTQNYFVCTTIFESSSKSIHESSSSSLWRFLKSQSVYFSSRTHYRIQIHYSVSVVR